MAPGKATNTGRAGTAATATQVTGKAGTPATKVTGKAGTPATQVTGTKVM